MAAGEICVARSLPIDAALVGDVLVRLRRDTHGTSARWSLGGRGSAEVDVDFFPVFFGFISHAAGPAWNTTARLWDASGVAVVHAVVEVSTASSESCELTLRPNTPLGPWWAVREAELAELAAAAMDELGEELLWHATRTGVAAGS